MDYTEKKLRRVNGYTGIIVDVHTDMIRLPNNEITMREVVCHPGGVCVAAVDEDGAVAMVRQYRYPFGTHLWELPAGKLEPEEEPLSAAKRELEEETGLQAEHWTELGAVYTSPGFSTETIYMYLATGLRQGRAHPDPNEFLDVERIALSRLLEQIGSGGIRDAKTMIGALLAQQKLVEKTKI